MHQQQKLTENKNAFKEILHFSQGNRGVSEKIFIRSK